MLLQFILAVVLQNCRFLQHFTRILQNLHILKEGRKLILYGGSGTASKYSPGALLNDSVLLLLRAVTPLRIKCQSLWIQFCFLESSWTLSPFKTHLTCTPASIFASTFNPLFTLHGGCFGSPNLTMSLVVKSKVYHLKKRGSSFLTVAYSKALPPIWVDAHIPASSPTTPQNLTSTNTGWFLVSLQTIFLEPVFLLGESCSTILNFIIFILESGERREKERERNIDVGEKYQYGRGTSICCRPQAPDWGLNLQPRQVP